MVVLMIRRPPRSTPKPSSAASDVYKRQAFADGRIDKYEDYTIRKIADLIYVRHEDFMKAKHR